MKIVIDMCLPPSWVEVFEVHGLEAIHWKQIGSFDAKDIEILEWARVNSFIVFTHDVDFGTLLALTNADAPSVIQVRTQDVTPRHLGKLVIAHLFEYEDILASGALLVIDESRARVKVLPFH